MKKFLMPLADYNRIYSVTHGVLRDVASVERACIFFAVFGSYILNKHYKIAAKPVAGAFAICVNDSSEVAFFGTKNGTQIDSDESGFHVWIQTKDHIIDFMSPIFREAFSEAGMKCEIPRLMLQKRLTDEVQMADDLLRPGDIFTLPDLEMSEQIVDHFLEKPSNRDLLHVAERWFGRRSSKQALNMSMQDDLGEIIKLHLPRTVARGSW
ncbi:DUF2026 family protein [Pacificibacter marinus]|nr:DUF2026 family protein [Pacificibacter marinus]